MTHSDGRSMAVAIRPGRMSDADDIAQLTTQLGYEVAASDVAARLSRILSRPATGAGFVATRHSALAAQPLDEFEDRRRV